MAAVAIIQTIFFRVQYFFPQKCSYFLRIFSDLHLFTNCSFFPAVKKAPGPGKPAAKQAAKEAPKEGKHP